jgi:hypothetical protein
VVEVGVAKVAVADAETGVAKLEVVEVGLAEVGEAGVEVAEAGVAEHGHILFKFMHKLY